MRKHFIKIISIFIICSLVILPIKAWDDLGLWDDWDDWDEYSFWLDEVVVYGDYDDNYDWGLDDDWWRSDYWDNDYGWDDYDDFDDWWDDYYDYYIPDNSETPTEEVFIDNRVPNGECVRGVIEELIRRLGGNPSSSEIAAFLKKYAHYDSNGKIIGYSLNSNQLTSVFENYFNVEKPESQHLLNNAITKGEYVAARNEDRSHEILLIGIDNSKKEYIYYDPVLGTSDNRISWDDIRDPLIIKGEK